MYWMLIFYSLLDFHLKSTKDGMDKCFLMDSIGIIVVQQNRIYSSGRNKTWWDIDLS